MIGLATDARSGKRPLETVATERRNCLDAKVLAVVNGPLRLHRIRRLHYILYPDPGQDIKTTSDHASRTYTASSEDFDSNA